MDSEDRTGDVPHAVDLVTEFLRGQNLEQLGRVDEAVALYEHSVTARFDSVGPYDRLIDIYSNRALHLDVIRVAEAALASVHTHSDKYRWYGSIIEAAKKASSKVPAAAPKKPAG